MSTLRPIRLAAVAALLAAACVIETVPLPEGSGPQISGDGGDPRLSDAAGDDVNGAAGDPEAPDGDAAGDPPTGDPGTPAPAITALDGNGSPVAGTGSNPAHYVADGLFIDGTALDNATVELAPDGGAQIPLVIREQSASRIEVELPQSLAPGAHTLTVSSAAGSDQIALTILQGEPGAACPE